ncbi:hypothetical protein BGX31_002847 [Mortierella sp. GBA43]|nr:hypothetical protein BGX31_002847 [Mortierella sp. GBA43]
MIWSIGIFMAHSITLLVYYVRGLSLYILWVGAMVDGLTGSVSSALALTHAYAADVTIPSSRTIIFGRIMAGYFGGFGLGAAWAGIIVVKYGVLGVFWVLPGLSLLNLLYLVLIPESISKNDNPKPKSPSTSCSSMDTIVANENPAVKHNANIAHHIRATFHSFVPEQLPNRLGGKYSVTKVMIVSLLALMGALGVNYQTSTYLMYRFNWSGSQLGLFGSIRGLSRFVTLTVFLPLAKRYAPGGPSTDPASNIRFDLNMLVVAILLEVLTLLMFGLATVGELFYVGAMTGAFGTMFYPTIRSILSRAVSPEMLGTALGALGTFEAISEIIAPPLTAWFYGITLETHPSAIFYLGAAIAFLGWALALSVLITHNHASVNL